jgi:hypothetical protein
MLGGGTLAKRLAGSSMRIGFAAVSAIVALGTIVKAML